MIAGSQSSQQLPPGAGPLSGSAGAGAAQLINRLLTAPRPGGMAGAMGTQPQAQMAATAVVFERGIAGVASKSEDVGIKVYNGKETYNEWEFVYDYRRDTGAAGDPTGMAPSAEDLRGSLGARGTSRPGSGFGSRRSPVR